MSDENDIRAGDSASGNDKDATPEELIYESNPKHSQPWQSGKRGSLCEPEIRPMAGELLLASVLWEGKRYAVHQGRAYCAQQHSPKRWHGFPVGWVEVPPKLTRQWLKDGLLTKRDRKNFWEGH